jgi:hypothetical protein
MKFKKFAAAAMMVSLTLLSGCGGGENVTPALTPASAMKGFWASPTGTVVTSAIVLASGDTWLVFQENNKTTRFARMQMQASSTGYSSTGTQYLLQSGTTEPASATGTFTEKSVLSGSMSAASGSTALSLAYDPRYETAAKLTDAVGSWTSSFGDGSSTLTMDISASGVLAGTSTTACSYNGTLQPRTADPAVFDVSFTESCLVGASRTLSGIATVGAEKTSLFFAATTADKTSKTSGALFVGTKL